MGTAVTPPGRRSRDGQQRDMNRRTLFTGVLALATIHDANRQIAVAQRLPDFSVIEEISRFVEGKLWADRNKYERDKSIVAAFLQIRIVYNGPIGDEAKPEFIEKNWRLFNSIFLPDVNEAVNAVAQAGTQRFDDKLEITMQNLLQKNADELEVWLGKIGIESDGVFVMNILTAMTHYTVAGVLLHGEGKTLDFGKFSGIFPFC